MARNMDTDAINQNYNLIKVDIYRIKDMGMGL